MRLLLGIVGNAVALLATTIVPGIHFSGSWLTLLLAGVVFGLFNLIVRPIALFLSLPALVLTLGLFYFVLNGILLWLAGKVVPGYDVSGILAGMLGAIVLSIANWAFHAVFGPARRSDE
ncbi:MAG TPA: phage holin family protein [Vicinamibacteria bacterium]|nr:phage holin family protein [Vicinamibacteria bacterium]